MFFLLLDEAGEQGRHAEAAHKQSLSCFPCCPPQFSLPMQSTCPLSTSPSRLAMTQTFCFHALGGGGLLKFNPPALAQNSQLLQIRIWASGPLILTFKSLFITENPRIHFFGFCVWLRSRSHEWKQEDDGRQSGPQGKFCVSKLFSSQHVMPAPRAV